MRTLWNLLAALPSLIKLLQALQARIDEAETKKKVAEDVQTIHEAFATNDPEKLRALFGGN